MPKIKIRLHFNPESTLLLPSKQDSNVTFPQICFQALINLV